jgi:hypothetical protein
MRLIILITLSLASFQLNAQGIADFKLLDVASHDSLSLKQYSNKLGIAIIFTSNDCAFDAYYTSRIKSIVEGYSDKIQFLLINSNQEPAESVEKMQEAFTKRKIDAPYLADKNQVAMNAFDAKKTPEVFLLKPTSGKFIVFYSGSLDDNPQIATDVKQNYLKDTIEKLLAGQKAAESVRAVGCTIRKK